MKKQLNITFEEMQKRNSDLLENEIKKLQELKNDQVVYNITLNNITDLLEKEIGEFLNDSNSYLPNQETLNKFIKEQEDLMKEKGIKFERIYINNNFSGWKVESDKLFCEEVKKDSTPENIEIKPTMTEQSKEDYKKLVDYLKTCSLDPKLNIFDVAKAISNWGEKNPLENEVLLGGGVDFGKGESKSALFCQKVKMTNPPTPEDFRGTEEEIKNYVEGLYKENFPQWYIDLQKQHKQYWEGNTVSDNKTLWTKDSGREFLSAKEASEYKGNKLDDGKLPISIVVQRQFPNALKAVAECSQYGNKKYKETDKDWCNLHRVDNGVERYSNAMMRHFLDAGKNLDVKDTNTNLEHIKHFAWNALALLEIIEQEKQKQND